MGSIAPIEVRTFVSPCLTLTPQGETARHRFFHTLRSLAKYALREQVPPLKTSASRSSGTSTIATSEALPSRSAPHPTHFGGSVAQLRHAGVGAPEAQGARNAQHDAGLRAHPGQERGVVAQLLRAGGAHALRRGRPRQLHPAATRLLPTQPQAALRERRQMPTPRAVPLQADVGRSEIPPGSDERLTQRPVAG